MILRFGPLHSATPHPPVPHRDITLLTTSFHHPTFTRSAPRYYGSDRPVPPPQIYQFRVRLRRGITAVMTGRDPPRFIPQFARFLYPSLRGSYTPVQEALTPQCMGLVHSSLKCTYTPVKEARKPSLTTSPPNDFCPAGLSRKLGISSQNYFASYYLMPLAAADFIASEGPPMRRRERIARLRMAGRCAVSTKLILS